MELWAGFKGQSCLIAVLVNNTQGLDQCWEQWQKHVESNVVHLGATKDKNPEMISEVIAKEALMKKHA